MNANKAWLVDFLREGCGKGMTRPSTINPSERFGVYLSLKPPSEYYKGPMTFIQALANKAYLEKVWA